MSMKSATPRCISTLHHNHDLDILRIHGILLPTSSSPEGGIKGGIAAFSSVNNVNRTKYGIKHTGAPTLLSLHFKPEQQSGVGLSRTQPTACWMQPPTGAGSVLALFAPVSVCFLPLSLGSTAAAYAAAGSTMKRARVEKRMIVR